MTDGHVPPRNGEGRDPRQLPPADPAPMTAPSAPENGSVPAPGLPYPDPGHQAPPTWQWQQGYQGQPHPGQPYPPQPHQQASGQNQQPQGQYPPSPEQHPQAPGPYQGAPGSRPQFPGQHPQASGQPNQGPYNQQSHGQMNHQGYGQYPQNPGHQPRDPGQFQQGGQQQVPPHQQQNPPGPQGFNPSFQTQQPQADAAWNAPRGGQQFRAPQGTQTTPPRDVDEDFSPHVASPQHEAEQYPPTLVAPISSPPFESPFSAPSPAAESNSTAESAPSAHSSEESAFASLGSLDEDDSAEQGTAEQNTAEDSKPQEPAEQDNPAQAVNHVPPRPTEPDPGPQERADGAPEQHRFDQGSHTASANQASVTPQGSPTTQDRQPSTAPQGLNQTLGSGKPQGSGRAQYQQSDQDHFAHQPSVSSNQVGYGQQAFAQGGQGQHPGNRASYVQGPGSSYQPYRDQGAQPAMGQAPYGQRGYGGGYSQPQKSKKGLWIGLGVVALVLVVAVILFFALGGEDKFRDGMKTMFEESEVTAASASAEGIMTEEEYNAWFDCVVETGRDEFPDSLIEKIEEHDFDVSPSEQQEMSAVFAQCLPD